MGLCSCAVTAYMTIMSLPTVQKEAVLDTSSSKPVNLTAELKPPSFPSILEVAKLSDH